MRTIKNFENVSNAEWQIIRATINDALDKAGKKLKMKISMKNISYSGTSFTSKLEVALNDGSVEDKYVGYKAKFEKSAFIYGLSKSDFLGEFTYQNRKWKLLGWNTRGRLLAERDDLKSFYLDRRLSITKKDGKLAVERDSMGFLN